MSSSEIETSILSLAYINTNSNLNQLNNNIRDISNNTKKIENTINNLFIKLNIPDLSLNDISNQLYNMEISRNNL